MLRDTTGAMRLPCPYCRSTVGADTVSITPRCASERIRRRKQCRACGERWSTNEVIDPDSLIDVTATGGGMQAQ